jgi:hypothetical protein
MPRIFVITNILEMRNYFFSVIPYRSEFESYQKLTSSVYRKYLQVSNLGKLPILNKFNSLVSFNNKNDKF